MREEELFGAGWASFEMLNSTRDKNTQDRNREGWGGEKKLCELRSGYFYAAKLPPREIWGRSVVCMVHTI